MSVLLLTPPEEGASGWPVLLLGVVILLLAAAVSVTWLRRRREVWRRFAGRHGLTYDAGAPQVRGSIDGHALLLEVAGESSDVGELGAQMEQLSLGLEVAPPADLEVLTATGISHDVERALEHQDLPTGDEDFDGKFIVRAVDTDSARAWLTAPRRAAFLRLGEAEHGDVAGLRAGKLFVEGRVLRPDLGRLEAWLRALRETARDLLPPGP